MKIAPAGTAAQFPDRLAPGTRVQQIGDAPRYYAIRLDDGRIGWSYKGNFTVVQEGDSSEVEVTKQSLLARSDVLKIRVYRLKGGVSGEYGIFSDTARLLKAYLKERDNDFYSELFLSRKNKCNLSQDH